TWPASTSCKSGWLRSWSDRSTASGSRPPRARTSAPASCWTGREGMSAARKLLHPQEVAHSKGPGLGLLREVVGDDLSFPRRWEECRATVEPLASIALPAEPSVAIAAARVLLDADRFAWEVEAAAPRPGS